MQFTPDGYTEPLPPRPTGLAIGAVVLLAGIGLAVAYSVCLGLPLVGIGLMFVVNEGGKRRIRVTRPRLLMEDESRVRGLLIGPSRSRVEWKDTASVELSDDRITLKATDGRVYELGVGGGKADLEKLYHRIEQVRNSPS